MVRALSCILIASLAPAFLSEASGDTVDRIQWTDSSEWACAQRVAVKPFPVLGDFKGKRPVSAYMQLFVDTLRSRLRPAAIEDVELADDAGASVDVVIDGEFLDLSNGSRAARFWVGFGAGKSKCHVRLTGRRASDGKILFTAEHERMSAMGLSADELAENVTEVARDLGEALTINRGACKTRASAPDTPVSAPKPSMVDEVAKEEGVALVDLESSPPAAEVSIDGEFVGMTPLAAYRVAEGMRQIAITKKGYRTWTRDLRVRAGVPTHVNAELEGGDDAPTPEPSPSASPQR